MKSSSRLLILATILCLIIFVLTNSSEVVPAEKTGCEAFMYVANNSLFEINVFIDNVGVGNVMTGKSKTFTYTISADSPKRVKTRTEYQDPDFIDPKSINFVTKTKVECGQSDTVYFGIQK